MSIELVHELPRRLRFKSIRLANRKLDHLHLEASLSSLSGVRSVRLNPIAGSVVVNYDGQASHRMAIFRWFKERFADAITITLPDGEYNEVTPSPAGIFVAGLSLLSLPLLKPTARRLLTYAVVAPTIWHGTTVLFTRGIKVEVLDSLAIGLAASRGEYFTAVATQGLLNLGEYLEHKTERHSDALLRYLLKPLPTQAWVERDGALLQIDCSELIAGDCIEVGTGDMIAIDGKVIGGNAAVNQASVTGESLAVRKEMGDKVLSGTVIEEGRLRIHVTRVGSETTTARIAHFIENSLQQQSKTQCLAEDLANKRVYITLGLGTAVYLLTRDIDRLASVFLVDYACALKLGTPVAIKSAMYHGAKQGLLFRGGQAIENLAEADTFVFDKTGTLTSGLLEVTDIKTFFPKDWQPDRLLALVASIEEHATHPIANAIVQFARQEKIGHIEHEEVDYLIAHGLTTHVNGQRVAIGSRHFLEEHEKVSFKRFNRTISNLLKQGKTLLYIAMDNHPLGVVALRDHLRPEAKTVIHHLRQLGIQQIVMLTGDQHDKAMALGTELGIDHVYADCQPEDKAKVVKQLTAQGYKVAFVGDGVNDAPALISAMVGIAMPKGADLARATADVVLLNDDLATIVEAKALSKATMQLIHWHFNLSTAINTGLTIGAVSGVVSPILSALLHNGTTIGILLNAMAGARYKQFR
ncbi:heavy metal translocating P-type ATPase [Beggiatoa leptomitoformis]|uniref:P-type Zn(2+) transporter n=1 Tax=Beggiatoa leptomitoformis TaxID=288004 RepID=A0A2N9YA27_9GAMM|nr:heavy metal translocating P-type ATPase [Beggiatoa leptomitoformis]ALG67276.1 heavy metal translocating P-type ATPase [Beggiatoa leptomitoformis]AUI67298.1 heavy metal translocating P-type ATPase [Beggiatoa leptomitoformis]